MRKGKKFFAGALLFGAVLLAGCGAGNGSASESDQGKESEVQQSEVQQSEVQPSIADDQLGRIRKAGEMVVAMEGTWAPWTYHDGNDNLVGFDVEVAQKIGEKLGVRVTFVEGEWDGLFAGLDAERYDMVVNGVEYTDERAQKYDFTEPYAYIRTAIIVKKDDMRINSFKDLDGMTTANTISSTYAILAESYGATTTGVDDLNQTIELLLAGRIDATLNAEVTFYDYLKEHPEAELKIAALTDEASNVVIPLRKGEDSASLRVAINQAIQELRDDGTLGKISQKYFGSDITQ